MGADPIEASSASTVFVRALAGVLGHAGSGAERLIRASGLDPVLVNDPNGRISLRELSSVFEHALDLTGDEALGLHLAELTTESTYGLIAHLLLHAPTIREAIALAIQFAAILIDRGPLVLVESGDVALLRYDLVRCTPRADRAYAEFAMLGVLRLVRHYVGQAASPRRAYFQHARPPHHAEYARLFGGTEQFGHAFTGIAIDRSLLDRRSIQLHSKLLSVLRSEAEQALDRVPHATSHTDRVMSYLSSRPPHALPDMDEAARDLGTSARSLQRRLVAEGTTFRALRQAAMERAALQILGDPRQTLQQAAHLLGFSNVSAFFRAFKRWKGTTPRAYRDTLRAR